MSVGPSVCVCQPFFPASLTTLSTLSTPSLPPINPINPIHLIHPLHPFHSFHPFLSMHPIHPINPINPIKESWSKIYDWTTTQKEGHSALQFQLIICIQHLFCCLFPIVEALLWEEVRLLRAEDKINKLAKQKRSFSTKVTFKKINHGKSEPNVQCQPQKGSEQLFLTLYTLSLCILAADLNPILGPHCM